MNILIIIVLNEGKGKENSSIEGDYLIDWRDVEEGKKALWNCVYIPDTILLSSSEMRD